MIWFIAHDRSDWWPMGNLRPECDRTFFKPATGEDEGLAEMMERVSEHGEIDTDIQTLNRLREEKQGGGSS